MWDDEEGTHREPKPTFEQLMVVQQKQGEINDRLKETNTILKKVVDRLEIISVIIVLYISVSSYPFLLKLVEHLTQ